MSDEAKPALVRVRFVDNPPAPFQLDDGFETSPEQALEWVRAGQAIRRSAFNR